MCMFIPFVQRFVLSTALNRTTASGYGYNLSTFSVPCLSSCSFNVSAYDLNLIASQSATFKTLAHGEPICLFVCGVYFLVGESAYMCMYVHVLTEVSRRFFQQAFLFALLFSVWVFAVFNYCARFLTHCECTISEQASFC